MHEVSRGEPTLIAKCQGDMRFGVLGPLHAQITGREARLDRPRQAKLLAALLVDANNLVAMERLVAVMWDGKAPATAVRQVQDAVSGLRRNLATCGAPASLISTRRGGYQIHLTPDQLDLLELDTERHLAERHTDPHLQRRARSDVRRGSAPSWSSL